MLITFRSRFSADVLMMEPQALRVLQAAGRDYKVMPEAGVFTVEQLPGAIAHLEEAIAEKAKLAYPDEAGEKVVHAPQTAEEDQVEEVHEEALGSVVQLHQRAYPLLQMMKVALENKGSVVWGDAHHY